MKPFLLALLSLAATAQATIIVNAISGDDRTLHADFFIDWDAPSNQTINGTWTGGSWQFQYSVSGPMNDYGEAISGFWLRTTWADGWNPGAVPELFVWHLFGHTDTDRVLPSNYTVRLPIAQDFGNSGHDYHLDYSIFGHFSTDADMSGDARMMFDLQRTPVPVPEAGSTLLLLLAVFMTIILPRRKHVL